MRFQSIRILIPILFTLFIFSNCKKDKEVLQSSTECAVNDLEVSVTNCENDSIFDITINFSPENPTSNQFFVHDENYSVFGNYNIADLPVTITGILNNDDFMYLKVAIAGNDLDTCQAEIEFPIPDCDSTSFECTPNLKLEVGDCCPGDLDAYALTIDFDPLPGSGQYFEVFDRDRLIGTYRISELPVTIEKFPTSGRTYDFVKICLNSPGVACCIEREYLSPNCGSNTCLLSNLAIDVGDCTCEDAFNLTINFDHQNVTTDYFDVYGTGGYFGSYRIDQLPVTLENYPTNNLQVEFLGIVVNDECEIGQEFRVPDCDGHSNDCNITDLVVTPGDCIWVGSYEVIIDFEYQNAGNDFFEVYASNGVLVSYFRLDQLPVRLDSFPWSGNEYDYLKVCINDNPDCCKEIEFEAPECILEGGDCLIDNLEVTIGDCLSDSTYVISIDFDVLGSAPDRFDVYARNNEYKGTFSRRDLPIRLAPWELSGRDYDYLIVCVENTNLDCCKEAEWMAPDCR